MLVSLSRLPSLTELKLKNVYINVASLDRAQLRPLSSVRSLTFHNISCGAGDSVVDIVAELFPNLERLGLLLDYTVRTLLPSYQ